MKPLKIWLCHELDTESERIKSEILEKATAQQFEVEFVNTFTESDFAIFRASTLHIPLEGKLVFFIEPPQERVKTVHVISNLEEISTIVIKKLSMYRVFNLIQ